MKKLLYIFILIMAQGAFGQTPQTTRRVNTDTIVELKLEKGVQFIGALKLHDTLFFSDGSFLTTAGGAFPDLPDSSVIFIGVTGNPSADSGNFSWNPGLKTLLLNKAYSFESNPEDHSGLVIWPESINPAITLKNDSSTAQVPYYFQSGAASTSTSYGDAFVDFNRNYNIQMGNSVIFQTGNSNVLSAGALGIFCGVSTGSTSLNIGTNTILTGTGLTKNSTLNFSSGGSIVLDLLNTSGTYTRSNGNPIINGLNIDHVLNMAAGTGVKRGIYVNTSLPVAVINYRAIESTNNIGHQLYLSGQAPNYLGSRTGIGVTAALDTLHVVGTARITITPATATSADSVLRKDATTGRIESAPAPLIDTSTLDFPNTLAGESSDLNITVTGAVPGNPVSIGTATASILSNSCYTAFVSAVNTVTVRYNNYSALPKDPSPGLFRAIVFR